MPCELITQGCSGPSTTLLSFVGREQLCPAERLVIFLLAFRIQTFSGVSRTCSSRFKCSSGSEHLPWFFFGFLTRSYSVLLQLLRAGPALLSLVSASVLCSPGMEGSSGLSSVSHPWALSQQGPLSLTAPPGIVPFSAILVPCMSSCCCDFWVSGQFVPGFVLRMCYSPTSPWEY